MKLIIKALKQLNIFLKQALAPSPPGGPLRLPLQNLRAYSYSRGKIGSGACVYFHGTSLEVVPIMPQT